MTSGGGGEIVIFDPLLSICLKRIKLPSVPTSIRPIYHKLENVDIRRFHQICQKIPSLISVACCDKVYLVTYNIPKCSRIPNDSPVTPQIYTTIDKLKKMEKTAMDALNSGSVVYQLELNKFQMSSISVLNFDKRCSFILIGTECGKARVSYIIYRLD